MFSSAVPDADFAAYAGRGCAQAFRRLVERHLPAVHAAARRTLGSCESLAEDVTQGVFILLARKAASLPPAIIVPAWLHRQAVRLSLQALRGESRRRKRESTAAELHHMNTPDDALWRDLQPHVDRAMLRLPAVDREALALRFLEKKDLREVGVTLGVSTDAAQKRIERALEKLRGYLAGRSASALSVAALAGWLGTHSAEAAPAHLVARVSSGALAAVPAPSVFTTILTIMTHTKALTAGAVLGLAAGGFWAVRSAQTVAASGQHPGQAAGNTHASPPGLRSDKTMTPPVSDYPRAAGTAEGLVAQLQEFVCLPNTEANRLRMAAWMADIPREMWAGFFQLVPASLNEWESYTFLPTLAQGWGRADPAAAIAALAPLHKTVLRTPDSLAGNAFIAWHAVDARAAQHWLVEHQDDAGLAQEIPGFVKTIAESLFAKSESDLLSWAARLGSADLQSAALNPLIGSIAMDPDKGAPRLCSLFLAHEDPAFSRAALQTVLRYWVHDSADARQWPEKAAAVDAWLAGLPQGAQAQTAAAEVLRRFATARGQPPPEGALKMAEVLPVQDREDLARQFITESDRLNPAARDWLLPWLTGADREALILHAARHVLPAMVNDRAYPNGSQGFALDWAAQLSDPAVRDPLLYGITQQWLQWSADQRRQADYTVTWEENAAVSEEVKAVVRRARQEFTQSQP